MYWRLQGEQTRSSAIAERPARRSVLFLFEMLITSRVSLRSTFSNCHVYSANCIVLYTHRSSKLNYRIASMRWSASTCVSSTDFHTTNLVDVNWTVTVVIKVRQSPMLFMTPRLSPPAHRRERGPPWQLDTNLRQ